MKATVLSDSLVQGLGIVGQVTMRNGNFPADSVLVQSDGRRLKLSACDLEMGLHHWLGARVEDDGAICVLAQTLHDLVKVVGSGSEIHLASSTKGKLGVQAGRTKASIKETGDPEDFPNLAQAVDAIRVEVQAADLRTAISQVAFAAATKEIRPILTGVLAEFEGSTLSLVAADGYRLSARTLAQPVADPFSVVIPARALAVLGRIGKQEQDPITVIVTHNRIAFRLTDTTLVSQLIGGKFPDYQQIIPQEWTTRTTVATAEFRQACKTAHIFARESGYVLLHANDGSFGVSATGLTGGYRCSMQADVEGDEIEIGFDNRWLLDVLAVIEADQVELRTTTKADAGVLRPVGDADYTHVLMPLVTEYAQITGRKQ